MKERPILFSGPMVRAILEGRKTQTRRVVQDAKIPTAHPGGGPKLAVPDWYLEDCPYGQPGERLWVRENGWERPERTAKMMREGADTWPAYEYDADGIDAESAMDNKRWGWKRRPSIFMPRRAARLTLEITGIRVERLQDISKEDALAEGITVNASPRMAPYGTGWAHQVSAYKELWESIHGPGSWDRNPWVWVITFKKIPQAPAQAKSCEVKP